jgi:hypothetical protein
MMQSSYNGQSNGDFNPDASNNREQPISLSSVVIVFISCGVLFIAGLIILLIEICLFIYLFMYLLVQEVPLGKADYTPRF